MRWSISPIAMVCGFEGITWYGGKLLPDWLTHGKFSRDQVIAILKNHIETVVQHYRGNVIAWDVVNKPFDGARVYATPSGFVR